MIALKHGEETSTRYGNILLLAPALKALKQLLVENVTLTKYTYILSYIFIFLTLNRVVSVFTLSLFRFFGLAEVDSLLLEFILDDLDVIRIAYLSKRGVKDRYLGLTGCSFDKEAFGSPTPSNPIRPSPSVQFMNLISIHQIID